MNDEIINILIIDDTSSDRELIKAKLKKHFPNATFILGEGLADYKERVTWVKPDIILCDYEMRDCNGLDILIESRKSWNVPFIFVTGALNNEEKVAQTILKGANGYVLKDNIQDLYRTVFNILEEGKAQIKADLDKSEYLNLIRLNVQKASRKLELNAPKEQILECLKIIENNIQNVI
ncbi:response regulator [Portibacter lacus]|uniref:Response regulatory domain-containing protein n=1 Tax=Portibacter lacus TaxID=1099794 RepID=A0AA37SR00_9BACT|nr:response regulator [Portibacter lacus]GLR18099.1 hypothetical protein GCM10007940_27140 [Portibacter lacus]